MVTVLTHQPGTVMPSSDEKAMYVHSYSYDGHSTQFDLLRSRNDSKTVRKEYLFTFAEVFMFSAKAMLHVIAVSILWIIVKTWWSYGKHYPRIVWYRPVDMVHSCRHGKVPRLSLSRPTPASQSASLWLLGQDESTKITSHNSLDGLKQRRSRSIGAMAVLILRQVWVTCVSFVSFRWPITSTTYIF